MSDVENHEAAMQPQQENASVDLTISDLKAIQNIIDAVTQRGAFRANELAAVGEVYNRLTAFIDSVTKKA